MPPRLRTNYAPVPGARLEAFYTGGPARALPPGPSAGPGGLLACACGDEVRLLDAVTGAVRRGLPGDGEPVTALALWAPPPPPPHLAGRTSGSPAVLFVASRSLQASTCATLETSATFPFPPRSLALSCCVHLTFP